MMEPALRSVRWQEGFMKSLILSAALLSVLGLADGAQAQQAGKLFFEGDIVRGAQRGAPGPFCVLNGQFKRMEKVVWRVRILDQDGKPLDDKAIKKISVKLPDGRVMPEGRYGWHPGNRPVEEATDYFWTVAWIVPEDYPSGTFVYKIVATDAQGKEHLWEPFKVTASQFAVLNDKIEIK
jgi:hypothetical protein